MRRTLLVLTSLSVLVACADGPAPVSPRDAVLDAMSAVYEAGTFHQELKMSMAAEGQSFSITAEADVDNEHQRIDMTMDLGLLGGEMQMVMDGGIVYMRSPAFADAPTPWVSMDPEKMDPAEAAQFGGFGAGTTDPSAYAGLFAGVFDVKDSGQVEIKGVSTTHYVGTIDLQKVLESFPEMVGEDVDPATKEQLEAAVEQFEALGIETKIPFEIWIDEDGLPRRQAHHDGLRRPRPGGRRRQSGDDRRLFGLRRARPRPDPEAVRGDRRHRSDRRRGVGGRLEVRRLRLGAPEGLG